MDTSDRVLDAFISVPDIHKIKIEWNDSFNINVKRIDMQHQRFFKITNELKDIADEDIPMNLLEHYIKLLKDYTVYHFFTEERLMREADYPGIEDQQKEHKKFIDKISAFESNKEKDVKLSFEMISFLTNWFLEHIQKKDKKVGEYLNSKGFY